MTKNKTYNATFLLYFYSKRKIVVLLFVFFNFYNAHANDFYKEIPLKPINSFDEVPVEIIVKGYLRFEADVIITDTQLVYINLEELFVKLGIHIVSENNGDLLKGFIGNENIPYLINFNSKQITRGDKIIKSENGIVKELNAIYVESTILNEAFGLNMIFNFRSLSIKLDADFELPMVKLARLEKIRENVSKLQSNKEVVIDTVIGRNYHLFNGGVLDWSISSNQSHNEKTTNRFSLGLGSELLFGEAKVSYNYYSQTDFDRRQLNYNWRWVDNDNNFIKQAQVGKINTQSIAYLKTSLVGASFNNSPNTVRKAKGTYTISEYTEPNWTVELYINDVLVDYTSSDASGLYVFNVPIVYGYTTLKLKFFGPLGEERFEERTMNTPYTFIPEGELEYNVSGGVLEDDEGSTFGRGEVNYGVNRFFTIGGGVEYLSNIIENPAIPFANLSVQPFSKMVINMEYAHNVSVKGLLNYYFGKSAFLEVDYINFVEGQQATLNNTNEERKIRLSLPYRLSKISGNTKFSYNQYVYDNFNFNQFDAVFSGRYKNYSANASLTSNWVSDHNPYLTSTLVFSHRLKNGLTIRPSFQYNITDSNMMRYRAEIEKRVKNMSFSASYERNVNYKTNNLFFSFKYDLPFARTGFTSSYYNDSFNFAESAQGSLAFGGDNGYVSAGNNSTIGKGGILLYPFLDFNQNGKKDKGEKMIWLNKVKVSGGKVITSKKDSIIRVSDLNAFINYNVVFNNDDLDNISWRFKHKTYQILIDPNQYKKVYIPIISIGEVSGMVYLQKENNSKGQGRITLQIFDKKGLKVAETLSEFDGYFSYLGLKPGSYTIKVDEDQLKKLGYQSTPSTLSFKVKNLEDGDIIDGLNFTIKSKVEQTVSISIPKDTTSFIVPQVKSIQVIEVKELEQTTSSEKIKVKYETSYTIQIGNSKEKLTPDQLYNLSPVFYEVAPNGNYLYMYGKYESLKEANNAKNGLMLRGIKGALIVSYKNGEEAALTQFTSSKLETITKDALIDSFPNLMDVNFRKISNIEGLFYSVQIGVFKNKVTSEQLLNLNPIFYEILPNNSIRYISGKYTLKKDAKLAKNKIVVKGIRDAYVVAYKNGQKIAVYELDKIRKHTETVVGRINGSVYFKNNTLGVDSVIVQLWNKKGVKVASTSTNSKGDYSFFNVKKDDYIVRLDDKQLEKLGYKSIPAMYNRYINEFDKENTIEKLDFILTNSKN